jgi:EAL domain-containing protein (putative c-di-GMP-specific phosphodiesterase class I)
VAVNVAAHQLLEPGFVEKVIRLLRHTDTPADLLTLELTEGVLVENTMATAECFRALQEEGVRISIDDFGTGYASLSYLHHFHFNELKIDRSFVRRIHANRKAQVIVRSVLDLVRTMGFTTVAEGVEEAEELQWLEAEGCQVIQGYLVSRPLRAEQWEPGWLLPERPKPWWGLPLSGGPQTARAEEAELPSPGGPG